MTKPYTSESEIEAVVSGFENCATPKDAFRHVDHLTVAVSYLMKDSARGAVEKMREALFRFLDHHGINRQKYHETLTVFWVELTEASLKSRSDLTSIVERCNYVRARLGDKDVVKEYYSPGLIESERARTEFVEPDIKDWRNGPVS